MRQHAALALIFSVWSCLLAIGCDLGGPTDVDDAGVGPSGSTDASLNATAVEALLLTWQIEGAIPAADVNGDGFVDIVDLVTVATSFGRSVDPDVADARALTTMQMTLNVSDAGWEFAWTVAIHNPTVRALSGDLVVVLSDETGAPLRDYLNRWCRA